MKVAAVSVVLLAWGLWSSWSEAEPAPNFERDLSASADNLAGFEAPYLHAALVVYTPLDAAIVDAASTPIGIGDAFEFELGFRTTAKLPLGGPFGASGIASSSYRQEWAARIRSVRELPAVFGNQGALTQVAGAYIGEDEGQHGLQIEEVAGRQYASYGGGSSSGTSHSPPDDLLLRMREPVVRLDLRHGLAMFLMLTGEGDSSPFDPGQRDAWLSAFESACGTWSPLPYKAVAQILAPPPGESRKRSGEKGYAPRGYGPAAELVAAGFVLHAAAPTAVGVAELRQDDALEHAFTGGARLSSSSLIADFYEEHFDQPRRKLTTALVRGVLDDADSRAHELALLCVVDDVATATSLVDGLLARPFFYAHEVLQQETLEQSADIQAQYQRLRAELTSRLAFPWGLVLRSPWLLVSWLLLVPMLALALVLLVRPATDGPRRRPELTPLQVTLIAFCSFVFLGKFSLATLLVPVWWLLALRWLRLPAQHGVAGRAVVWLAVTLASIEGLRRVGWYTTHELAEEAGSYALLFCWCLVAFLVVQEGGWRIRRLWWFLIGLLALHALPLLGSGRDMASVGVFLLCCTVVAMMAFVAGGRRRASS